MKCNRIYCAGSTAAIRYAAQALASMGYTISNETAWNVNHLLLDIPSFLEDGSLKSGAKLDTLLTSLPKDITIWGGNLNQQILKDYTAVDLLQDELYLAKNAAITADCAVQIASPLLNTTWQDTNVLIIGWGRIGKCLGSVLKSLGSHVTVAARKDNDLAMLQALGYDAVAFAGIHLIAPRINIVFNTAPCPILTEDDEPLWQHCVKIDLASRKGIAGKDVVWARGLPGIHAPMSSGKLIAETVSRLWKEDAH